MNLWKSVGGTILVELVGANPLRVLRIANENGIVVTEVKKSDDLTISFEIQRRDYRKLSKLVRHRGCRLRIKKQKGVYWTFRRLLLRPVLVFGFMIIGLMTLYIPSRIAFVQVVGNQTIPDKMIIEAAAQCGIDFGASRRTIRSEKVKNALLAQLPQLQWLGVNTYGCTAVISVQEKTQSEAQESPLCISSIVASRDGVITDMTVSSGTPVCKNGQAVRAGQLLVSGYSDCGICIHGTQSQADIFANTQRNLEVLTPNNYRQRRETLSVSQKYSLIIGKKRINFYKGSGISATTCGKMYEEIVLTLPGGFQLPVAIATETWITTAVEDTILPETQTAEILKDFSEHYLSHQMVAGEIIHSSYDQTRYSEADRLLGTYMCREMIGRIRIEETIDQDEENN